MGRDCEDISICDILKNISRKGLVLGEYMKALVALEVVEKKILLIRGQKVILDVDLANTYGVSAKVFNQAIKRNINRFPKDFMFQLTVDEALTIRSQFVTASKRNIRYLPYAFTEHGIIMAEQSESC
jgi:hypothetical protein